MKYNNFHTHTGDSLKQNLFITKDKQIFGSQQILEINPKYMLNTRSVIVVGSSAHFTEPIPSNS